MPGGARIFPLSMWSCSACLLNQALGLPDPVHCSYLVSEKSARRLTSFRRNNKTFWHRALPQRALQARAEPVRPERCGERQFGGPRRGGSRPDHAIPGLTTASQCLHGRCGGHFWARHPIFIHSRRLRAKKAARKLCGGADDDIFEAHVWSTCLPTSLARSLGKPDAFAREGTPPPAPLHPCAFPERTSAESGCLASRRRAC